MMHLTSTRHLWASSSPCRQKMLNRSGLVLPDAVTRAGIFGRRPSLLRRGGAALIPWADRSERERTEYARRAALQRLPSYLRRDLGLPPLDAGPSRWEPR